MRRLLAVVAVSGAAVLAAPGTASALCYAEVHGICVSPCDLGNLAYRTVTGSDLTSC